MCVEREREESSYMLIFLNCKWYSSVVFPDWGSKFLSDEQVSSAEMTEKV